jgi:hypothetical protein
MAKSRVFAIVWTVPRRAAGARWAIVPLLCAVLGGVASGQQAAEFGVGDESVTTYGYAAFQPSDSSASFFSNETDGLRAATSPLIAPLAGIPNGAIITQVAFYYQDVSGPAEFHGELCRSWIHSSAGDTSGHDCPVSVVSAGTPGNSVLAESPVGLELHDQVDIDNDGILDSVQYYLKATTSNFATGLRMAQVRWKRQVSPAPSVASFSDVPTNDPRFQFIEALAASKITAGCGSGKFCPNDPLTRAELAVMLAKALGLHWPAVGAIGR